MRVSSCVSHAQGGAIINGLSAFAKHGDPYARALVARLLQAVCVPLLDMIRAWVFEGRLLSESTEFFVATQAPGELAVHHLIPASTVYSPYEFK